MEVQGEKSSPYSTISPLPKQLPAGEGLHIASTHLGLPWGTRRYQVSLRAAGTKEQDPASPQSQGVPRAGTISSPVEVFFLQLARSFSKKVGPRSPQPQLSFYIALVPITGA